MSTLAIVGIVVGLPMEGFLVGVLVGLAVVGLSVGALDGLTVEGELDGAAMVGENDGLNMGTLVGANERLTVPTRLVNSMTRMLQGNAKIIMHNWIFTQQHTSKMLGRTCHIVAL